MNHKSYSNTNTIHYVSTSIELTLASSDSRFEEESVAVLYSTLVVR